MLPLPTTAVVESGPTEQDRTSQRHDSTETPERNRQGASARKERVSISSIVPLVRQVSERQKVPVPLKPDANTSTASRLSGCHATWFRHDHGPIRFPADRTMSGGGYFLIRQTCRCSAVASARCRVCVGRTRRKAGFARIRPGRFGMLDQSADSKSTIDYRGRRQ